MSRSRTIDVAWGNRKLEDACSSDAAGIRRWGADRWSTIRRRLASVRAAPTLADLDGVPGGCHQLTADRVGQYAMTVSKNYRLIFILDHDPLPTLLDGGTDRARVTAIRILEVVDYHGR